MLIRRSELRLALTAGLMNGFGALAPVAYGFYAPLAVLVVCTGTYGGSIGLGRQRLLGSVAGAVVLVVSFTGLSHLPLPLGLSLALVAMRLLGAALGLEVGYKVGSNIIVMGWLVHDGELGIWVPVRLFWTVAGILVALVSLRLFWPDLAVETNRQRLRRFLADLGAALVGQADRIEAPAAPLPPGAMAADQRLELQMAQGLRRQLVGLREAMPAVADELGNNPTSHATFRLFQLLNGAGSQLVGVVDGLRLLEHTPSDRGPLEGVHGAQAELLRAVAARLEQWNHCLEVPHRHRPAPPSTHLEPPPLWESLERWLHDPELDGFDLILLQRNASRLMLCGQALHSIEQTEHSWRALGEARG
ncbi:MULTISPECIES: FUSC family protein [unclassified Cyanobium]|uniref:FUSC family protein n=1 Tax=unclassified Cyanobium TaxID=2627006 RepID=UPI0020CE44A2|nr:MULTISPECIES: FUSC family protein [unclassified Cyanobium]MCP9834721.1 FUSC family protein [Cyanobium sp. La Preciosa 7G6]MCP9937418.1 FUSC family protein [Cyanobium sp. Aljojuca 7A6]